MIVKTRVFELCCQEYRNLSELAQAMGISVSQIYRVQQGKRNINQKFIVGAIKAFPNYKLDDLFYLAPELPAVNNNHHRSSATNSTNKPAAGGKQVEANTQQALKRFASATEEYSRHLKSHTSAITGLNEASQEVRRGAEVANTVLAYLTRKPQPFFL